MINGRSCWGRSKARSAPRAGLRRDRPAVCSDLTGVRFAGIGLFVLGCARRRIAAGRTRVSFPAAIADSAGHRLGVYRQHAWGEAALTRRQARKVARIR